MKVKMILPALTEAKSPYWRPIKYSLFPPLGLATLAAYLDENDEVILQDEHVETLEVNDAPDLVAIQVYITSAYCAYELADHYRQQGAYVALGGLHVTSLPHEAAQHADTIFLDPGEDTWPSFLSDFRAGHPKKIYQSQIRTLVALPRVRRDLIKRHLYLVPNSIVVSRGCPHTCDFCYKYQNLNRDYNAAIRRLHDLGVMVNASFVFGMDDDDETVFARTVEWAVSQGIETATFHILTPYPDTALYQRMTAQGRMLHHHWDLFDTRHVVFRPAKMAAPALAEGYWQAYRDFYRWGSIFKSAWTKQEWTERCRHIAYAGGWKKFEFLWDWVIRTKRVTSALPVLEAVLACFGRYLTSKADRQRFDNYEPPQPTNTAFSSTNTASINRNAEASCVFNHFAEL